MRMVEELYYNGQIFTSNTEQLYASAMVVKSGKIVWVGNQRDVKKEGKKLIDLQGRRVLPGFIDAHMHPLLLAEVEQQIYCGPPLINSIEQLLYEIRKKYEVIKENKKDEWVRGWGFDEAKLREQREITRWDLDRVAPDIPVIITRACSHIIIVNSFALKLAGIDRNTTSPIGGQIDVDDRGEINGILREKARYLFYDIISDLTLAENAQLLTKLSCKLSSQGITTVTDMMSKNSPIDYYDLYKTATSLGYKQRTVLYYIWEDLQHVTTLPKTQLDSLEPIHIGGVKLFADGSISGKTAWVEQPYLGDGNNTGLAITTEEELLQAADFAKKQGIQLVVHAMGEKAIKLIVDTFANQEMWIQDAPSIRIEHGSFPTIETLKKAQNAGIGFVTQPIFLFAEYDSYLNNLGVSRVEKSYPFKTMLEHGVTFSFSSDAPATSWPDPSDPFIGIKAAVTRKTYTGLEFNRNERVTIEEAVLLYTKYAQQIIRVPKIGQLKPGYFADFIVLDKDILTVHPEEIDEIKVLETYSGGEKIFSLEELTKASG